jgi:hypothetical protein
MEQMIDKFNPPTVHDWAGYSHVTISNVGRLAHPAGQRPLDCESPPDSVNHR